ncbi:hypothetical protein Tco_1372853, partial [Tanacetum coccineum]
MLKSATTSTGGYLTQSRSGDHSRNTRSSSETSGSKSRYSVQLKSLKELRRSRIN